MLNFKKPLSLFLAFTCSLSIGITNPLPTQGVQTASAATTVTVSDVKQAYISYLLKNENKWNLAAANAGGKDSTAKIGIKDMDQDGLPELLISLGSSDRLYTYLNGKVTLVSKTSKKQYYAFCSAKNLVCRYYFSSDSVFNYTYYTLKNGKLTSKYKLNSSQINGKTVYTLNGSKISTKEYQSFQKNYAIKKLYTVPLDHTNVIGLLSPGFSKNEFTVSVGESIRLPMFLTTDSEIHFASKKKSVAYFKSDAERKEGIITGKKAGSTTISATVGNQTYQCVVTVTDADTSLVKPVGLAEDTKIKEDLDGDGMHELIYWKSSSNEKDEIYKLKLQVDDQKITIDCGMNREVYLVDINPEDSYKELYVESTGYNDVTECSVFYRYDGSHLTEYAKVPENAGFIRATLAGITKNQHFRYYIDTPYPSEYLGMYQCSADLALLGSESSELTLLNGTCLTDNNWRGNRYTPLVKLSVKTGINSTKTAFTLKPGSACFLQGVYQQNGSLYIKLENSAGKTGWLALPSKQIFYESNYYLWG